MLLAEDPMVRLARRALLVGLVVGPVLPRARAGTRAWVVSPAEARTMISAGALVLDARAERLRWWSPVAGAVPVPWRRFTEPDAPRQGRLLADDAELSRRLQALGVRLAVPVVVLGDPLRGWAEDGRIVWMLRALGHRQAVVVDGGLPALAAVGLPEIAAPAGPGDFVVARRPELEITREELRDRLGGTDLVVLDAREPREYAGQSPYGESRGGHLPGARSLPHRSLLSEDGTLLPADELRARLAALGIGPGTEVVAYCTGGVRSGWVTAVLNDLGIPARNYAGSMLEWAAGDPESYPLTAAE
jgi:thiosulfate/3-mercaptopyruvate sulfurtransferase